MNKYNRLSDLMAILKVLEHVKDYQVRDNFNFFENKLSSVINYDKPLVTEYINRLKQAFSPSLSPDLEYQLFTEYLKKQVKFIKSEIKETNKVNQIGFDLFLETKVKTVNNTVVTQLAWF